jgi:hypothetical protein
MAQDAPPRELPTLINPDARVRSAIGPRLVPLSGPRRQSTTIAVNLRAVIGALAMSSIAIAFLDTAFRSAFSAQLVRWQASALLLLCVLGATVLGNQPQRESRRYLIVVAALLGLSFLEAAPRSIWPYTAAWLESVHYYPFLTLVTAATIACGTLAFEAKQSERIVFAPALIVYIVGLVAALLSSDHHVEHALSGLMRSVANIGRLLGPVLALRAMLHDLSPPDNPAAVRFMLLPGTGESRQTRM